MKRIAVAAAAVSVVALGAFAPASAEACPEGTLVEAHLELDLNGEQQSQDICLPPAAE